jgi:hypothetical protein
MQTTQPKSHIPILKVPETVFERCAKDLLALESVLIDAECLARRVVNDIADFDKLPHTQTYQLIQSYRRRALNTLKNFVKEGKAMQGGRGPDGQYYFRAIPRCKVHPERQARGQICNFSNNSDYVPEFDSGWHCEECRETYFALKESRKPPLQVETIKNWNNAHVELQHVTDHNGISWERLVVTELDGSQATYHTY